VANVYNTSQSDERFSKVFDYTALVNGSASVSSWSGSAPYTASISVSGILSTDKPIVDIDLSSVSFENIQTIQDEWSQVYRASTSNDSITLYSLAHPINDFNLLIRAIR
jgi:hypothetical protein